MVARGCGICAQVAAFLLSLADPLFGAWPLSLAAEGVFPYSMPLVRSPSLQPLWEIGYFVRGTRTVSCVVGTAVCLIHPMECGGALLVLTRPCSVWQRVKTLWPLAVRTGACACGMLQQGILSSAGGTPDL